jgi:hypothetical protein
MSHSRWACRLPLSSRSAGRDIPLSDSDPSTPVNGLAAVGRVAKAGPFQPLAFGRRQAPFSPLENDIAEAQDGVRTVGFHSTPRKPPSFRLR